MELEETRKTLSNKAREAAIFEDQLQKENDNREDIIMKLRKLEEDNIAMMKSLLFSLLPFQQSKAILIHHRFIIRDLPKLFSAHPDYLINND